MTVIASFAINGCPVLVGDLLLSGKEDSTRSCHLPTVGEVTKIFPEGSGYVPVGVAQKIYIVDDDFALAWAGSLIQAKTAISSIVDMNSKVKFTPDSLWEFIKQIELDPDYSELSLICMIGDGTKIDRCSIRASYFYSDELGEVFVAGTGSEAIINYLKQVVKQKHNFPEDPLTSAISLSVNIFGCLISDEMAMPNEYGFHSLQNYFGAGYEIATYLDHKVTKIDDIIQGYWTAHVDGARVNFEMFPFRMYKYYYIDKNLYIFSSTFILTNIDKENIPEIDIKKEIHIVQPIIANCSITARLDVEPKLTAKWNISHVLLAKRDGSVQGVSRLDYRPNGESLIKISHEGIEFDKDLLDDLMKRLYRHV